jgi:hypothetical protein
MRHVRCWSCVNSAQRSLERLETGSARLVPETVVAVLRPSKPQPPSGSLLRKAANDFAGVSRCENSFRHIAGHRAPSSNDGSIANTDTGTYYGTAPNPNIRPRLDWFRKFEPLAPGFGVEPMRRGIDLNGWTEQHIAPDSDLHYIEHHAIKIEEDPAAQSNIRAVIAKERRSDPRVRFDSKRLGQHSFAFLLPVLMRVIESIA